MDAADRCRPHPFPCRQARRRAQGRTDRRSRRESSTLRNAESSLHVRTAEGAMTLNVPSFFAGIGTVVVLLTLGFGGGVMMSGVISDKPREPAKVEKWAAEARKSPAAETEKPPVVTATPVPVAPAPAPAPVTPTPVAAASSAQPVAKEEPAPQAAAQPVSQLQPPQGSTVSPPSA